MMRRVARQLGRYHVLDRIAFGGMAEIFRALTFDDHGRAHIVAIKQVLPHYAEDHEFIDMLVDEAKLVSMLHHKNIVEIFEVGYVDSVYFVAMDYVHGKDLRAVLERCRSRGTRVPFEVSAYILAEALSGLDTAHRLLDPEGQPAGLVHRDFSPSNILIHYDGSIKICDFGIAKATFSRIQTKTGVIKGKVKYMSPEQAFGRKLDHRSDVFSAGSVLYEMLTNEPPFMAKNEIDLIFMVRDARITPPRQRIAEIPTELEQATYKSMTRARGSRYQSAAEFRATLLAYLRRRGAGDWRAEMARFMGVLYADDMEREQSAMASFDLEVESKALDLGRNLIADVLGANARYTKYNPFPTSARPAPSEEAVHDASTRIIDTEGTEDLETVIRATEAFDETSLPVDQVATAAVQMPEPGESDKTAAWERPSQSAAPAASQPAPPEDAALRAPPPPPQSPAPPPAAPPAGAAGAQSSSPPTMPPKAPPPVGYRVPPPKAPGPPTVPQKRREQKRSTLKGAPPARIPSGQPVGTTAETTLANHHGTVDGPPPFGVDEEVATSENIGTGEQPTRIASPSQGGLASPESTSEQKTTVAPVGGLQDPPTQEDEPTRIARGSAGAADGGMLDGDEQPTQIATPAQEHVAHRPMPPGPPLPRPPGLPPVGDKKNAEAPTAVAGDPRRHPPRSEETIEEAQTQIAGGKHAPSDPSADESIEEAKTMVADPGEANSGSLDDTNPNLKGGSRRGGDGG